MRADPPEYRDGRTLVPGQKNLEPARAIQPGVAAARTRTGLALAVLGACFLVVMMDNTILNVALQTLQRSLGATNSDLQWSVDSYILVYAALMFSAGVLADSYGRRRVLVAGLIIFAGASAMSAYSVTPKELILWRALMGIGGAAIPPTTLAIIKQLFPAEEQGRAMSIWAGLGAVSVAFGPILGGLLLEHFWWGSVFLINVPIIIICVITIFIVVPESRATQRSRLDLAGTILSVVATGAIVFGVIRGGETNKWMSADVLGAIILGLLLMVGLVLFERTRAAPALDIALFRSAPFTVGTLSVSLSYFALTGGVFLLVFYVQLVRGYTPLGLGLVLLPVAIGSIVSAIASPRVSSWRGPRFSILTGLLLLSFSLGGLSRMGVTTEMWILELILLAAGLGMGSVMSTTTALVMEVVPTQKSGAGAAVNNTVRQIGAALGVAVMGSVYSVGYRTELGRALGAVKLPFPRAASDSLSSTVAAVQAALRDPRTAQMATRSERSIVVDGKQAFVASMHASVLIALAVIAGAVVVSAVYGLRTWRWSANGTTG